MRAASKKNHTGQDPEPDQSVQKEAPQEAGAQAEAPETSGSPAPAGGRKKTGKTGRLESLARKESKSTFSWTMLYEARMTRNAPEAVLPSVSPGRPPRPVPVKTTTVTYTAGDEEAIRIWQVYLTGLLGRKPSMGETAGILARICSERLAALGGDPQPASLAELVGLLVGADGE